MAIKRAIARQASGESMPAPEGISENDLRLAFNAEFVENDIFPPTDMTEDWFKLIDYDPEKCGQDCAGPSDREDGHKAGNQRNLITGVI